MLLWTLAFFSGGCATTSPGIVTGDGGAISEREIAGLLRENPLKPDQNLGVSLVRQSEHASVHLVQVRWAEKPHIHTTHDLTVFVIRGGGQMTIGTDTKPVRKGDVIHIPAGARHFFVNRGEEIAVAVAVFSPPFDGKDIEPVK